MAMEYSAPTPNVQRPKPRLNLQAWLRARSQVPQERPPQRERQQENRTVPPEPLQVKLREPGSLPHQEPLLPQAQELQEAYRFPFPWCEFSSRKEWREAE